MGLVCNNTKLLINNIMDCAFNEKILSFFASGLVMYLIKKPVIHIITGIYFLTVLSHQDSNLDKQNQNLLCCHYTIGQFSN